MPGWWWKIDYKGSALSHCKERETRTLTLFRHGCSEEMIPDSSFGSKCLSKAHVWNVSGIFIGLQMASTLLNLVRQNDIVTLGMALTAQCLLHCRVRPTGQSSALNPALDDSLKAWDLVWTIYFTSFEDLEKNLVLVEKPVVVFSMACESSWCYQPTVLSAYDENKSASALVAQLSVRTRNSAVTAHGWYACAQGRWADLPSTLNSCSYYFKPSFAQIYRGLIC